MSLDLDPDAFWRKTPREIVLIIEGRGEALNRQHNDAAWLAWHIVRLGHVDPKKFPKLETLLSRKPVARRRQSTEQMLEMAAIITAMHGGEDKRKLN